MNSPAQSALPRRAVLVGGGAVLAAPFISRAAHAAAPPWVLYTTRQRNSLGAIAWQAMADAVKAATLGALQITVVTAGRMPVDANAITPAVSAGTLLMGDDSYFGQYVIPGGIPRLPMLVPDRTAFRRGSKAMRTYLAQAYDARNAVVLAYTFTPKLRTWSSLRFDAYAGLNNRRIRAVSAEQGEFIRRLGGIPVTIPTADVPRGLKAGEIDTVFTFAATGATAWQKQLKTGYASGPHHFDAVLIANKSAFRTLPKDTQEILVREAAKAESALMDAVYSNEDENLRKLADSGLELEEQQTDDVSAITSRMSAMWDEWTRVRGREAQDLLYAFKRAMEVN